MCSPELVRQFTAGGGLAGMMGMQPAGERLVQSHQAQREALQQGDLQGALEAGLQSPMAEAVGPGDIGGIGGMLAGLIKAYHGSPHRFNRFDLSRVGSGEGAQAFGHGLYFAENPTVARQYRDELAGSGQGHVYDVDLDVEPGQLLDWDAPLSSQSPEVRQALEPAVGPIAGQTTGAQLYEELAELAAEGLGPAGQFRMQNPNVSGSPRSVASQFLAAQGVPGLRYLDAGSRGAGEGSRNIVLFRDDLANITGVE